MNKSTIENLELLWFIMRVRLSYYASDLHVIIKSWFIHQLVRLHTLLFKLNYSCQIVHVDGNDVFFFLLIVLFNYILYFSILNNEKKLLSWLVVETGGKLMFSCMLTNDVMWSYCKCIIFNCNVVVDKGCKCYKHDISFSENWKALCVNQQ